MFEIKIFDKLSNISQQIYVTVKRFKLFFYKKKVN